MISANLDMSQFKRNLAAAKVAVSESSMRMARDLGPRTKVVLQDHTREDTGKLKDAWDLNIEAFRGAQAGARFDILIPRHEEFLNLLARWWEYGTGIYGPKGQPIKPKKAKFLHWKDRKTGEDIFARQVKGIPAQAMVAKTEAWLQVESDKRAAEEGRRLAAIFGR